MTSRRTLYLLCGLAFAGKSALAAALRERLGCPVVSLDEINVARFEWPRDDEHPIRLRPVEIDTWLAGEASAVLEQTGAASRRVG